MDSLQESHVRQLETFLRKRPVLGQSVYIAHGAVVVGDVTLGDHSSVWYNAVLRGDINRIVIGHHTNVQDHAMLHVDDDCPCILGNYVTVGHTAIVHGCTVGDESLIGMGSVILDRANVGRQCLIGAKALVTQGSQIPDGSLVLGMPAKVVRPLSEKERQALKHSADKYAHNAGFCLERKINVAAPLAS